LDARAADADAGADAIHLEVDAGHGDLRAIASLASQGFDLDGAVLNLGNLVLEQAADEIRVRARENDLHAMADLADVKDDGFDAFAGVVCFTWNLLAARQDRLGLAEGDDAGAAFVALNGTVHQVALHGRIFIEDGAALGLANLLDHHLLGGLSGDAAELRRVDDLFAAAGFDLARLAVDGHDHARLFAVLLLGGELDRGFEPFADDLARDVLVVVHLRAKPQNVGALHHCSSSFVDVKAHKTYRSYGALTHHIAHKTKKVGPRPLLMPPRAARRSASVTLRRPAQPTGHRS